MPSSFFRSPSQSTTHGSYLHDSDQDAHDYTRLRLQRQLAKDLLVSNSFASEQDNDSTLGIMEGAAAMSTRRLDDILPPSTPNLDSKLINAQFKDFSTVGVAVRSKLFPHLSNNPDSESIEVGRGGDDHTKTDRSTTSIFPRALDKGKLAVPNSTLNAAPKRSALSPNARARYQPTVADESMDTSTRPLVNAASRLQGAAKRSKEEFKTTRERSAREKLEEATRRDSRAPSASFPAGQKNNGITSAFLNTEKLFRDMGFSADNSGITDPGSPSLRQNKTRAASKPHAPSYYTANSIKLPDMTGISDLVSSVNHGESNAASRRAQQQQHIPIGSIPVPQGEQDLMAALRQLQEKVAALESDKAKERKRADELEKDYEQTRQLYQIEYNGRRELEAELNTRKRADSALGGEIDSQEGSPRSSSEREKLKAQHKLEIKKLDSVIAAYRHRVTTIEASQTALKEDVRKVTEEKDSAIGSLARALAKSDTLDNENESLRQENDELRQENEELANEVNRMAQVVEQYEKLLEHERKLMSDKINRYREKVARASRIATEATNAANDAVRLSREARGVAQKPSKPSVEPIPQERHDATRKPVEPIQQSNPTRKVSKPKEQPDESASNAEDRVQQQVDAELRKMFGGASASQSSKGKAPAREPASRPSTRPYVRKPMPVEDYSESETEDSVINRRQQIPTTADTSMIQPHMDTTFTDPSCSGSRIRRESDGDMLADDTLHSFIRSDGIAALRNEIQNERKTFEEEKLRKRQVEELEARRAHVLAERTARRADMEEVAGPSRKRVFIYSQKDNETTITEPDHEEEEEEEETPHPHLRTSMVVNEPGDEMNFGDILRDTQSGPAIRQNVRQQESGQRRDAADIYNDHHVQEVIDRLGVHNPELCTICHRKSAIEECNTKGHSGNIVNQSLDEIEIPEVVPVSQRMPEAQEIAYDADITIRPSQPPKAALDKVVKQMQDELEHMRLDYKKVEAEFIACDPSLGRRKRKALTHQLNAMVEEMDKKSDQIYALYDVAEMVHGSSDEEEPNVRSVPSRSRRSSRSRRDGRSVVIV
ncbi:hypothetical protein ABW19_dt0201344 [Dactylella cylindrospora]|nr:hypothetical protein ABW19_dt0201344 [Dactylella cylindrospora]